MGIGDWGLGIGDWGLGIGPKYNDPSYKIELETNKNKILNDIIDYERKNKDLETEKKKLNIN